MRPRDEHGFGAQDGKESGDGDSAVQSPTPTSYVCIANTIPLDCSLETWNLNYVAYPLAFLRFTFGVNRSSGSDLSLHFTSVAI